ncbi:FxLD family lantipeptide [Planosporangium thailandense]|uniref:FxLD family lantipeptide n=1 Tax=Planosporangium thailandense TaxID=765197 RepID=A0ABX0Y6V0_9ACTN|nr:FxLD family lanthipeptide [Planosporangium thailandense]NJC73029.1 FxLD family lantipeptide [Planosporangium thailandense]
MPATLEAIDIEEIFDLDVVVIPDADRVDAPVACGTSDGCAATCASSCVSRGAS